MQHAARFYKVKNYSDRELQREKLKQADFIQPMRGSRIFSQGKGGGWQGISMFTEETYFRYSIFFFDKTLR